MQVDIESWRWVARGWSSNDQVSVSIFVAIVLMGGGLGILLHEGAHYAAFRIAGVRAKDLRFGIVEGYLPATIVKGSFTCRALRIGLKGPILLPFLICPLLALPGGVLLTGTIIAVVVGLNNDLAALWCLRGVPSDYVAEEPDGPPSAFSFHFVSPK